jgi:hypothetical protein
VRSLAAALALLALLAPGAAQAAAPRYAVVVGSNRGAPGRPALWYAEKDAERFRQVLLELGDFAPGNVQLLAGAGAGRVRAAIAAAGGEIERSRAAGQHPLLVFYFSGHAAAGGIELGTERLSFEELRSLVVATSADAKIAIVDACEAGLLTQVKGATAAPDLAFALPAGDPVRGTAFVTSTAVGESAQESAALGGSFFTHHLEVALRGAGDADGDGLVTLGEAFRYTSAQTLAGTLATVVGAQHATYEFKMSGRGDVVLSDLRRADARLVLPRDPGSTYILRGPMSLLAEVAGGEKQVTLALPSGKYRVERRSPEGRAGADLVLGRGVVEPLPPLAPTRYELARAKGGPKPGLLFAGVGVTAIGLPGFGVAPAARVGVRKEVGPVGVRVRLDYLESRSTTRACATTSPTWGSGGRPVPAQRLAHPGGGRPGGRLRVCLAAAGGSPQLRVEPVSCGPRDDGHRAARAGRVGVDASLGLDVLQLDFQWTVKPAASVSVLALWGF